MPSLSRLRISTGTDARALACLLRVSRALGCPAAPECPANALPPAPLASPLASPQAQLLVAASAGELLQLRTLLKRGAPVDYEEKDTGVFCLAVRGFGRVGSTPLHYAARIGHHGCVSELLSAGASLNKKNKVRSHLQGGPSLPRLRRSGRSAVELCVASKHLDAFKSPRSRESARYRSCGSLFPANRRAQEQITPMHFAAANGHLETVKRLHAAGADIHVRDMYGEWRQA